MVVSLSLYILGGLRDTRKVLFDISSSLPRSMFPSLKEVALEHLLKSKLERGKKAWHE